MSDVGEKAETDDPSTVLVRQMTDEQLAAYRETGLMPPSNEIPLVRVTSHDELQASGESTGWNGSTQTKS